MAAGPLLLRLPVASLFLAIALSGCLGSPDARKLESLPDSSATEETSTSHVLGAVEGVVIDEEELPIANVTITISGTELRSSTDVVGRFAIAEVPPGAHTLIAERSGFGRFTGPVDVTAGATTRVTVQLLAVTVGSGPVVDSNAHDGYIECSVNPYYAINPCGDVLSDSVQSFAVNPDGQFELKEVVLELVWEPTTAATGQDLELDFCPVQEGPSQGTLMCVQWYGFTHGASPQVLRVPAAALPYPGVVEYEAWVGAGYQSPYPAIQQDFDLWVSLCYVQNCPPDFSALPPE